MPIRTGGLRWSMMFFLIAPITFVMSLDRTAIAVAAPTIQHEYGFSLFEMSVILTSFSWTYALLQVPGGWLAERFGPRRTLFWANALWSALTAATPLGLQPGLVRRTARVARRRPGGGLAKLHRRHPPLVPAARARQGQLHLARRPVSRADRRRADHHLGHSASSAGAGRSTASARSASCWASRGGCSSATTPRNIRTSRPEEQAIIGAGRREDRADDPARRVLALPAGDAVLGDRRAVFLPGDDPEFLHHVAADLPGDRPQPVAEGDGHLRLAAVGGDVLFGVRHRQRWPTRSCAAPARSGRRACRRRSAGFVVSAVALMLAARAPGVPLMMALLCVSLAAVGVTQVSIWPSTQDLGRSATGLVSGWTNFWGNAAGVAGPMLMAALVHWTGGWSGAMVGIAHRRRGGRGAVAVRASADGRWRRWWTRRGAGKSDTLSERSVWAFGLGVGRDELPDLVSGWSVSVAKIVGYPAWAGSPAAPRATIRHAPRLSILFQGPKTLTYGVMTGSVAGHDRACVTSSGFRTAGITSMICGFSAGATPVESPARQVPPRPGREILQCAARQS